MSGADPLLLCLSGQIGPEVALARMLLAGETAEAIARRVREARIPGKAWADLARVLAAREAGLPHLRDMIDAASIDHAGASTPERIAALFDRAVAASPEASVALYSLGDPATLAAATGELVSWLSAESLIGPEMDILDLGCGIGRVAAALAGRCRSVLGVDVSPAMIAQARLRCAGLENMRFAVSDGRDLAMLPDAGFDLMLAVDSFPYLIQAGLELAERHFAEAARVLRPRAALAILNFSYRGDQAADAAQAMQWAHRHGLEVRHCGVAPFRLWDASAYVFTNEAADGSHGKGTQSRASAHGGTNDTASG